MSKTLVKEQWLFPVICAGLRLVSVHADEVTKQSQFASSADEDVFRHRFHALLQRLAITLR